MLFCAFEADALRKICEASLATRAEVTSFFLIAIVIKGLWEPILTNLKTPIEFHVLDAQSTGCSRNAPL